MRVPSSVSQPQTSGLRARSSAKPGLSAGAAASGLNRSVCSGRAARRVAAMSHSDHAPNSASAPSSSAAARVSSQFCRQQHYSSLL